MNQNDHARAREMIALGGMEDLTPEQQGWFRAHLETCLLCREYAASVGQAVRALHADPFAADLELVWSTQMLVRTRSAALRRRSERAWLVSLSCLLVGVSSAITTPLVWRAFAWLGAWAGISSSVWRAGFTFFWIAPALVVGAALVARGTHLSGQTQWR